MPLITGSGYYCDRNGNRMWVRPNSEGWLDGLPFLVTKGKHNRPLYTVNEEGLAYPDNHKIFKDTQGYWQPNFWGWPSSSNYYDLIQKVNDAK